MKLSRLLAATASVTAVAAIAPAGAYAGDTATGATTTCGALPAWTHGRPADVHVRATAGDYLWHDSNGWHLRVTHHTRTRMVFAGRIVASSPITFTRVRDERRDKTALSADGKTLTFRFVNFGGIDGVDFSDACATTAQFAFAIDGHRTPLSRVFIGAHSTRPQSNPFTITRQDSSTAA